MEKTTHENFQSLDSKDKSVQYEAYQQILKETENEVDWAYEVWDELVANLKHKDNHKRSRAAQFLAYLAISDPEKRMLDIFLDLWEVTKDEKFVTARHSLQTIWRVGLAGEKQKDIILKHFKDRFINCQSEKNYTLIRFDIIQGLKNFYEETGDKEVKKLALELIEIEEDSKYQKKYAKVWK